MRFSTVDSPVRLPELNKQFAGGLARPARVIVAVVKSVPIEIVVSDKAGGIKSFVIPAGAAHIRNATAHYGNREYNDVPGHERQTYENLGVTPVARDDQLSRFLRGFWSQLGYPNIEVCRAVKCAPSVVVGQVLAHDAGHELQTHEARYTLRPSDWILQSPFDPAAYWLVTDDKMSQQFSGIYAPSGELLLRFDTPVA